MTKVTVIRAMIVQQRSDITYSVVSGKASLRKQPLSEVCVGVGRSRGKLPAEGKGPIMTQKRGQEKACILGIRSKDKLLQPEGPAKRSDSSARQVIANKTSLTSYNHYVSLQKWMFNFGCEPEERFR